MKKILVVAAILAAGAGAFASSKNVLFSGFYLDNTSTCQPTSTLETQCPGEFGDCEQFVEEAGTVKPIYTTIACNVRAAYE
jgi:hypothetical protein